MLLAFPGTLALMYLWIFTGPGILDGLPLPDKKSEDSKEEEWERSQIE
jgi:hypothetical protein